MLNMTKEMDIKGKVSDIKSLNNKMLKRAKDMEIKGMVSEPTSINQMLNMTK